MSSELPIAKVVHTMSGRARLRIPERRGDAVFFASVATGLATIGGVHKVEVRPLTGSIVLRHGPPLERIGKAAREARLFVMEDPSHAPAQAADMPIDPRVVVGLGMGVLSLWQLLEGRILPPAITLAWYAASLTGLLSDADASDIGNGGE
jgi:hypothetical protein